MKVAAQGLRVVEDSAVETGGVGGGQRLHGHGRRTGLTAGFQRGPPLQPRQRHCSPTTAATHIVIFGQTTRRDGRTRTYERLRSHNPVPVRVGACGDGWHTRNLPIDRIIGGPVFRSPETDCLLQVAGLVAQALLWREESTSLDSRDNADAFAVLDRALNRRASRNDPQGVVRR